MAKMKNYVCYTREMERPLLIEGKSKKDAITTVRYLGYSVKTCQLMNKKKKRR